MPAIELHKTPSDSRRGKVKPPLRPSAVRLCRIDYSAVMGTSVTLETKDLRDKHGVITFDLLPRVSFLPGFDEGNERRALLSLGLNVKRGNRPRHTLGGRYLHEGHLHITPLCTACFFFARQERVRNPTGRRRGDPPFLHHLLIILISYTRMHRFRHSLKISTSQVRKLI